MIHIISVNDQRKHEQNEHCHCNPTIKDRLVIYNAFEGREVFEQAMELLKNMN